MDVVSFLVSRGVACKVAGEHHHATADWVQVDCPYCSPRSGKFRLGFSTRSRACNCWVCGPHQYDKTIAIVAKVNPQEARLLSRSLPSLRQGKVSGTLSIPFPLCDLLNPHVKFLRGKRIDPDVARVVWQVRGVGQQGGRYRWRIFIPVIVGGEVVSWTTRAVGKDVEPRYLSASVGESSLPIKSVVYGADYVRSTAIVCEGPTDVWAVGPGAVCTFGTSWTEEQMVVLSKFPRRVVCFDADLPGKRSGQKLANALKVVAGETILAYLESGKDPGEAREEEIACLRKLADNCYA